MERSIGKFCSQQAARAGSHQRSGAGGRVREELAERAQPADSLVGSLKQRKTKQRPRSWQTMYTCYNLRPGAGTGGPVRARQFGFGKKTENKQSPAMAQLGQR